MCPITINKALLLQEGILKFELSWTAVAESVLSDPEIIIKTVSEEKNIPRYNYEGNKEIKKGRIMAISVITSVSDDPEGINEVITVIPKLTMTAIMPDGSTQGGGEVIYERSAD